jgi:hypothetical protein
MEGSYDAELEAKLQLLVSKLKTAPMAQIVDACKNMFVKIG